MLYQLLLLQWNIGLLEQVVNNYNPVDTAFNFGYGNNECIIKRNIMNSQLSSTENGRTDHIFSGNIFIFQAFDFGDDINLEKIQESGVLITRALTLSKYFKNYHIPLVVELPNNAPNCFSAKIQNFSAVSLTYKIPFNDTLDNVRKQLDSLNNKYQEQSIVDAGEIYKKIKDYITKPNFFHIRSTYVVIQVDPQPNVIDTVMLKEAYGSLIASALRFETQSLSEYQKNEILESAVGYYRGDFIVIDTESAFVYDAEYGEILDFFEFANIQALELRYYDRVLDQQLNIIYEGKTNSVPLTAYLPFIGTMSKGRVDELGKLKVDISVITERLESSIKLAGESYFFDIYSILEEKLGLKTWRDAIDKKLAIISSISSVLQKRIDSVREDMLTTLIIILIFIELLIGLFLRK